MPRSSSRRRGAGGRSSNPWNPLLAKVLKYLLASNKLIASGKLPLFKIVFESTTPDSEVVWSNIEDILQDLNIDDLQITDYTINPDIQSIDAANEGIVEVNQIINGRRVKLISFAPGYNDEYDEYFERFIPKESVMDYDRFFLTMPYEIDLILRLLNYYHGPDAVGINLAWQGIQQQFEILKRNVSTFIDVSLKREHKFSINRDYYEEYRRLEKLQEYYINSASRSGIIDNDIVEFNNEIVVDFNLEKAGVPKWYPKNQSIYNLIRSFLETLNRVRRQTLPQIMRLIDGIPFEFLKSIVAASARDFKLLARNSACTESSQCFPFNCYGADTKHCVWDY